MSRDTLQTVPAMLARALEQHRAGNLSEAERLYGEVLRAEPHNADALHLRGVVALQSGRDAAAVDFIAAAIAQNAAEPSFHSNLGNALQRLGRFEEAAACYQRALTLEPDRPETLYNLAAAFAAMGRLDQAAETYGRVLAHRPESAEAHNRLGLVLQRQGKLCDAIRSYRQALLQRPAYGEAHYNLGTALQATNEFEPAERAYRDAIRLLPDLAEAWSNLGVVQSSLGRSDEAAASFRQALQIKPDYALARLGLAIAAIPIFADTIAQSAQTNDRFMRALDELETWSSAHPGALGRVVGTSQPYHLLYRPQDITAPLRQYGALVCAAAAEHWRLPSPPAPRKRDRVRLGIVCGYVHGRHPVWNIVLKGILAHLDRRRFEIVVYHTGLTVDDHTARARARVDRFVQGPKTIPEWLDEIARDRPDVIFHPEIGMDATTCALASLRLAPLQVTGQGNAFTTGFPTIDLYFSGALMEGPQGDRHYTEKLIRLPGTGLCLEWNGGEAEPWSGPPRPLSSVRFALWLQPIKFDPENDVLYARIARQVGACEFWLVRPNLLSWTVDRLRDRMAAAFRAEGLDPDDHLRIGGWLGRDQLSGLFDAMDVYLDSPAFSGCTTAWQAIHRGLPIVTLEGAFLRQRQTAGLLRQIAVTEGVVSTRDGYVEAAVRLGRESRDPAKRAARREAILAAAPKLDGNVAAVEAFGETLIGELRDRI